MSEQNQKEYNKKYYIKNKEKLIKSNVEYQKKPEIVEKRKKRIRQRYAENHLGYRDKNLKSHDECKKNPEWIKRKRLIISIWGIKNRTPEINKKRWDKYYSENKEAYKKKRRVDKSHTISNALKRAEHSKNLSVEKQVDDIKILKNYIKTLEKLI